MKGYFVYILANKKNGTLYVGFTNDIIRRLEEHKNKVYDGFTKKYDVTKLVYYERHITAGDAMKRKAQLKKWNRNWKIKLITKNNPDWLDLSENFLQKLDHDEILRAFFNK